MAQMLGWFRVAAARASRRKRSWERWARERGVPAGEGLLVGVRDQKAVGDELESDFTFEPGIERAIDLAHAAGTYLLDHSVGPKGSARTDHSRP